MNFLRAGQGARRVSPEVGAGASADQSGEFRRDEQESIRIGFCV
jgi:hypothetical protein